MTGWLVYDAGNVKRNRFYIDKWMDAARRHGIRLKLLLTGSLAFGICKGKAFLHGGKECPQPDFVVMRAQRLLLSQHLETMGVPVFNNARVADICNDKRKTHLCLSGLVPMMDTAFIEQDAFVCPFPFPVVVKAAHGYGGRQVYLASDEAQYLQALSALAPDAAAVQPLCDEPGRDLRLYVLGDRVIRAMLRHSTSDFRSNVGQGGSFTPCRPDTTVLQHLGRILPLFRFGLVGVDFLFHQGEPVFNEIEDVVGSRMLYAQGDIDIAAEYLDFIRETVAGGAWPV